MTQDVDLIVVGAGAAGLAAARTALSLGLTVAVLEAKARIGGRAFTDEIVPGVAWDRGAHWLHDAGRNAYAAYAAETGFPFDRAARHLYLWGPRGWAADAVLRERDAYYDSAFDAIDRAGEAGLDIAASEVLPDHPRFRVMFESWYAAVAGAEPALSSTLDDSRYLDAHENWRVRPGYGALVAAYGAGLPVKLSCPVERIRWDGPRIATETPHGTLRGRAAVVTLSTTALARGAIRFTPELPPEFGAALAAVPLGTAEKVAFAFERDIFGLPENSHVHFEHARLEATRFHIRPGGHLIAIAYLAGRFAAGLLAEGEAAMIDFAEAKLAEVFGPAVRSARIAAAATGWAADPHIGGGYSVARPGAADLRAVLGRPLGERLFFAGEACSIHAFGTVHGAHQTGVAAARAAAEALRVRVDV